MDDCHLSYITKLKGKNLLCLALNDFFFCNLTFDSQKKEALSHENDETLPTINKTKAPKKRGNTRNKMGGPTSKKTKEPPKRANHKGNIKFPIKFPNLLLSREAYQIRVGEDHWVRSEPNSWKS